MKLNAAQKLAVETIDGPVMVIAGPGTGKTQIIAERIAQILKKTDTLPDGILALTFTDSGAKAMRQRLLATIGRAAYYVNIATFHSFCSSVIQEFADRFAISLNLEPLSELERVEIFNQILSAGQFKAVKPANSPFFHTQKLVKAIQDLKREAVVPATFLKIVNQERLKFSQLKTSLSATAVMNAKKELYKNQDLARIYQAYEKILTAKGRYDFEDMINFVRLAFKQDKHMLRTYQERLLYFLVDEYQDTNSAQNQVLELLASYWKEAANVFVVGDPNQSIFRFQGASTENFVSFKKLFPKTRIINLEQNYRSTQTILDAASAVIAKNHLRLKQDTTRLKSQSYFKETNLSLVRLPSEILETFWIGQEIEKLIKKGVAPDKIAVLYRNNADADSLAEMLTKFGLTIDIEGGGDVLKDPVINQFLLLLQVINDAGGHKGDDLNLFTLLNYQFLHLDHLDLLKLSRAVTATKTNLIDFILSEKFTQLKLDHGDKIVDIISKLSKWRQLDSRNTFSQFFEIVLKESGFLRWLETLPGSVEKLNRLNSLFAEIKSLNQANHQLNLQNFIKDLELMRQTRLAIIEQDLDIQTNSVTLSTVHKAKGREWDYVFIYRCIDTKWGNNRTHELIHFPAGILNYTDLLKKEKNEDERRLFYVAVTRAKKKIYLSYADRYSGSSSGKAAVPSMFISEIPENFVDDFSPRFDREAKKAIGRLLKPLLSVKPSVKEKQFLDSILKDFKLSATALNTYLACNYKFKLNSLIRVPKAKRSYLSFGTAVHKAFELFYRQYLKTGQLPEKKLLLIYFKKALAQEVLPPETEADFMNKGAGALADYYDYYRPQMVKPLEVEKYFGGFYSKPRLDDIALSGKIDRIDLIDKGKKTVRVVDYKTGPAKSQNDILGKTKNSSGDLYRQLVFYKLLFVQDQRLAYQVVEAELDFVESGLQKGKFIKRSFDIPDQAVTELKATIKKSMQAIRNYQFNRTTDYRRHCVRCEYRDHCWPEGIPTSGQ
ncbi:MAG TPA: ATP-dependent DNA helicase [Patescibacteria group bacterium]|nr:ATP-dependent DNA helicase [Patescibacteria group bacterium]